MSDIAVHVDGISKKYRIGGKQERYRTFRDVVSGSLTAPFRRVAGLVRGNAYAAANLTATTWALRDVSFEVKTGEVIGIIGRNGAGKSTLLKILSRITEPTEGRADIYGRLGALLEVGTGFHPELSGRENISLNAAILGMTRGEIKRKFDEIVAFAEVEEFIDTPVKHYSSGMALRLGFSVAAHLEPEILVVDEVLAVGDLKFQAKCLDKMRQVGTTGRTVLFVSHNLAAVQNLCPKSILLDKGTVVNFDETPEIIKEYIQKNDLETQAGVLNVNSRRGLGNIKFTEVEFQDDAGMPTPVWACGKPLRIILKTAGDKEMRQVRVSITIRDMMNQVVTALDGKFLELIDLVPANGQIVYSLPCINLAPGRYSIGLFLQAPYGVVQDHLPNALQFEVVDGDFYGTGKTIGYGMQLIASDFSISIQ